MNKSLFYKMLRSVYSLLKRFYTGIYITKLKKENLVFVFGGRVEGWTTLARELYNNVPAFKDTIIACDTCIIQNGGKNILSYFADAPDDKYFEDEERFICLTAIQIAITKLYNEKGIYPNAVIGVSLGEAAAGYAAGALTLADALKVCLSWLLVQKYEKKEFQYIYLGLPADIAASVLKTCSVWAEIICQEHTDSVIICCHYSQADELNTFFKNKAIAFRRLINKVDYAYHTIRIKQYRKLIKNFIYNIQLQPLRCSYFSPTLGRLIPENTILGTEYWFQVLCKPVLFNTALQVAINDVCKIFLQIGSPATSYNHLNKISKNENFQIFNSLDKQLSEIQSFESTCDGLRKRRFNFCDLSKKDELKVKNNFITNFDAYQLRPDVEFDYIAKNGSIHFLPKNNAWLVLSCNHIDSILKQPQIFSSSGYTMVDSLLIGSAPVPHKVFRDLVQPFFSANILSSITDFTTIKAEELLESLLKFEHFDFLADFSEPLVKMVISNFLGFNYNAGAGMESFTGTDRQNQHWDMVGDFFSNLLNSDSLQPDSICYKIRAFAHDGVFTVDQAISLLRFIWTAGLFTTRNLNCSIVLKLFNDPDIAALIKDDEKLITAFIEECLRMYPPANFVTRTTTQPVELGNHKIPAGSTMILHMQSGNRDPSVFEDPEMILFNRSFKRNLSFGAGIHQCIGMGIARAEMRAALKVILSKKAELDQYTFSDPEYYQSTEVKFITALPVEKSVSSSATAVNNL